MLDDLARRYRAADPVPHIALDDFLTDDAARRIVREFPAPGATEWIQYKHINENKLGKNKREEFPPHAFWKVGECELAAREKRESSPLSSMTRTRASFAARASGTIG